MSELLNKELLNDSKNDELLFFIRYKRYPFILILFLCLWTIYFMLMPILYSSYSGTIVDYILTYFNWGHGRFHGSLRFTTIVFLVVCFFLQKRVLLGLYLGDIKIYKNYIERIPIFPFFKKTKITYSNALIDKNYGCEYKEGVWTVLVISAEGLDAKSAVSYARSRICFLATVLCSNRFDELQGAHDHLIKNIRSFRKLCG